MKKIKIIFLVFISIVSILACENSTKKETLAIEEVVKSLYSKELDYRTIDTSLISPTLILLFEQAIQKEQERIEAVKNSDSPTDKPEVIEGDIFTCLYEGATDVKIKDVVISKNHAIAKVVFQNSHYNQTWEEELNMIKTATWKLDNVIYNPKYNSKGCLDLQSYIKKFYNINLK